MGDNTYTNYTLHADDGEPLPAVVEEWSVFGRYDSVARYATREAKEEVRAAPPRWLAKVHGIYCRRTPHYPTDRAFAQRTAEEEINRKILKEHDDV